MAREKFDKILALRTNKNKNKIKKVL